MTHHLRRAPDQGEQVIAKVRSAYLRDESKYDRWGAQGKILATLEVFRREGVRMEGKRLERYVNIAFPRTFSCQRTPAPGEALPAPDDLRAEHALMAELLHEQGVHPEKAARLAMEEIGERRCLDVLFLRRYLTRGVSRGGVGRNEKGQ